jgi:hypothetical protein
VGFPVITAGPRTLIHALLLVARSIEAVPLLSLMSDEERMRAALEEAPALETCAQCWDERLCVCVVIRLRSEVEPADWPVWWQEGYRPVCSECERAINSTWVPTAPQMAVWKFNFSVSPRTSRALRREMLRLEIPSGFRSNWACTHFLRSRKVVYYGEGVPVERWTWPRWFGPRGW